MKLDYIVNLLPLSYMKMLKIETLEAKGTPEGDCIIWTGASGSGGYPMMRYNSEMRTVHSVIAQMKYGKVPNRESVNKVTRTCKNIKCINSNHIVVMTKGEIMMGAHQTGFNTLLNADMVRSIRKDFADNPYRGAQRDLAIKYGLNSRMIWNVVRNRLYKWVK